ncbi:MAG: hypothetical protein JKY53_06720, partial [Flavobacteriales bacterium]|nr:hypothetical protein [Flavobacteriales bacterium]
GHGRDLMAKGQDLMSSIGWFTNMYPACLHIEEHMTDTEYLQAVSRQLDSIPNKGVGYGIWRYLCENDKLGDDLKSLPQAIIFCYWSLGRLSAFSFQLSTHRLAEDVKILVENTSSNLSSLYYY